jgi:sialate O-acetylesterase
MMRTRTRTPASIAAAAALAGVALAAAPAARAEVKVAALVGDHMVVQRGRPVRLSGTAAPGEAVSAALGGSRAATKADAAGRWLLALPALAAGGPYQLTIEGAGAGAGAASRLSFGDVWVGEVWIASGQSNMELPLVRTKGVGDGAAGGCPGLRFFIVAHDTAAAPKGATDVAGSWQPCDASTAEGFSAAAFYFGREIHRALGVPVGLVQATWGGTPAEAWTPRETLAAEPSTQAALAAFDSVVNDPAARGRLEAQVAAWEAKSFHQDTGNKGEALGYARPGRAEPTGDRGWARMTLPQVWENAGLPIDGAVWFRREITIPAAWTGAGSGDLALSLGPVDDFDVTYWNGERIGATGSETKEYWAAPRRYVVPARLVKAGRNVIAVRVFDHYGNGGFAGTAAMMSVGPARPGAATLVGTPALPLAGAWSYKIERRLAPAVVDWGTRPVGRGADDPTSPSVLWNAMVAPLAGTPAAGVIWYQGESNVGRAAQYRALFPAMIRGWRAAWREAALPFLFVQLPNFAGEQAGASSVTMPADSPWAELREAQAAALALPRTAMAVALDVGEAHDLHPHNKQEVGRRLALAALRAVYGLPQVIAAGPTFAGTARDGHALRVHFAPEGAGGGLVTADGAPPRGFIVAGADRVWRRADARIDGPAVIVSSPDVPEPVAVRYGWADDPENTLRNQADLPAAPFRSDDWPAAPATAATSP